MNAITRVKTATIIVGFPLDDERDEVTYTFPAGTNLAAALMEISPDRWGGLTFELYAGAVSLDGFVKADQAPEITLKSGEVWHVAVYPAEPVSGVAIIGTLATYLGGSTLAYVAATVIVYVAITAISMAISYGISMLLASGKSSDKSAAPSDQPTSLNGLSPPRNMMRPMSRIPDIYGKIRHWPDLIFPAWSRWEMTINPNPEAGEGRESTIDKAAQFVQAVYCLGRGRFDIENARFGDSPISSANGTYTVYPPGSVLPATVKQAYDVKTISRFELNADQTDQFSPWYEIGTDAIDEVWFQISFPGGVMYAISGKKVYPPKTYAINDIVIQVEGERLDESGAVVETLSVNTGFNAITRNELRQTYAWNVTPGRWRFRVAQTARSSRWHRDVTFQSNKKTYLEGIVGFRSLTDAERTFAHETVIIVNANTVSSPAIQNMDAFNVIATRRLPTQVVGAPPGTLSAEQPDRRWITAAINTITDPFLCNYASREIDWASLVEVQTALEAYTDPYDEGEFNGVYDRQMSADEQLQSIAKKARAIAFMSHGRLTFARDQRRSGVSAIFNRRNRMAERGNIGLGLRLPGPDEYDGVEISWLNEFDEYRQNTYSYPEGITPLNPLSIDLAGATKPWEVCRRARFEYASQIYRRRTQPLRVTEEGQLLLPYDRVGIVAPWDEGVIDGEVIEISGTDIRLDRPLPAGLTGNSRIRLRSSDGRQTSLHSLTPLPALGPEWLTLDAAPSFALVAPGDDKQIGTLYNLSQDDNYDAATQWLVTGAEIDDRGVTLTLMEDADEVYQLSDDLVDPCIDGACVETLAAISPRFTISTQNSFGSPNDIVVFGSRSAFLSYGTYSPQEMWKVLVNDDNTLDGQAEVEPGATDHKVNSAVARLDNGNFAVAETRNINSQFGVYTALYLTTFDAAGTVVAGPTLIAGSAGGYAFGNLAGMAKGDSNSVYLLFNTADASDPQYVKIGKYSGTTHAQLIAPVLAVDANSGTNLYYQPYRGLLRVGDRLIHWYLRQPGNSGPVRAYLAVYDLSLNLIADAIRVSSDIPASGSSNEFEDAEDTLALRAVGSSSFTFAWIHRPYNAGSYEDASLYVREFDLDGAPLTGSMKVYDFSLLFNYSNTDANRYPSGYAISADGQYLVVYENTFTIANEWDDTTADQVGTLFKRSGSTWTQTHQISINPDNYEYDGLDYGGAGEVVFEPDGTLLFVFTSEVLVGPGPYDTTTDLTARRYEIVPCV